MAPGRAVWAIRYKHQVELTPNTTSAQQEPLHESKYKDTLTRNKKLEDKEDQDEQGCINSQPENESSQKEERRGIQVHGAVPALSLILVPRVR